MRGFQPGNCVRTESLTSRAEADLVHKNVLLAFMVEDYRTKYQALQAVIRENRRDYESDSNETKVASQYPVLQQHFDTVLENINKSKNDYPDELTSFYLLISHISRTFYDVLIQCLGFPSWESIKRWKRVEKAKLNLSGVSFKPENVLDQVKHLLPQEVPDEERNGPDDEQPIDSRIVGSIDAVSLNSYVKVSPDGTVEGIDGLASVPVEEAHLILETPDGQAFYRVPFRQAYLICFCDLCQPFESESKTFPFGSYSFLQRLRRQGNS
jgi:hypothetical protein